jgi:hypothetical protein
VAANNSFDDQMICRSNGSESHVKVDPPLSFAPSCRAS